MKQRFQKGLATVVKIRKPDSDKITALRVPEVRLSSGNAPQSSVVIAESPKSSGLLSVLITLTIAVVGTALVLVFNEDITNVGLSLIQRYGQTNIYIVLFLITAISCSPICLPVWIYAVAGTAMGYDVLHLAVVLALGSATGSLITYYLGAFFSERKFFKQRFPKAREHPWIKGKSRWIVTILVFLGTASPIPCDAFYLACGIKRFPAGIFYFSATAGRFVRYLYLGYGFETILRWFGMS